MVCISFSGEPKKMYASSIFFLFFSDICVKNNFAAASSLLAFNSNCGFEFQNQAAKMQVKLANISDINVSLANIRQYCLYSS